MATDRLLIGPMNSGLETALKPFLIAEDAFSYLNNAYVFRGRIRKRFGSRYVNSSGSQLNSRLRMQVGTVAALGSPVPGLQINVGSLFSVGTQIFTVNQAGVGVAMLSTGPGTGTVTTGPGSGVFNIINTGLPGATPVYWYPGNPVMGIKQYETQGSLNSRTFVFDTQFAYEYVSGGYERLGTAIWTGSDSQFFSATTWRGTLPSQRFMFVVNNNAADGIKYWNDTLADWVTITPQVDSLGTLLKTAQIVVAYKGRLDFLNTTEGLLAGPNQTFTARSRWSLYGDPTGINAFRQDIPGQGNFVDAATQEDIVSAQFIKDTLVVFFESSTWSLAYYGNQVQPFTWLKVNTELGAEAFASTVPFDKVVLTIGNVGIHACNGVNVERIDDKIPDTVFEIHTGTSAIARVAGIRDYFVEQVYWTFPNQNADPFSSKFPNQIIVYNYKTGSWAINDDSITAFGYYFQDDTSAVSWQSLTPWTSQTPWISGLNAPQAEVILAGNQEGYMFIVDAEETRNASVIQVTNLTTVGVGPAFNTQVTAINHNFNSGDFVIFTNLNGTTFPNPNSTFEITTIDSADTFTVEGQLLFGADSYTGGGTIARASRIDMLTKQFNPYMKEGRNIYLNRVDFLVDSTETGEIAIDFLTSTGTTEQNLTLAGIVNGMLVGNGRLSTIPYNPQEEQQDQLWHPVYMPAEGMTVQLRIYLDDTQMADIAIVESAFQLHLMILNTQRTTMRPQ